VRQRTLVNLGRHFEVPRERWPALAQRIEQLISGQGELMAVGLEPQWEEAAQRYGAMLIVPSPVGSQSKAARHPITKGWM
jgi:hypothetical protein